MTTLLDSKLLTRFNDAIDAEDERAKETMANGLLQDFSEYRYAAGYRKALADAKKLAAESYEDILKE